MSVIKLDRVSASISLVFLCRKQLCPNESSLNGTLQKLLSVCVRSVLYRGLLPDNLTAMTLIQ